MELYKDFKKSVVQIDKKSSYYLFKSSKFYAISIYYNKTNYCYKLLSKIMYLLLYYSQIHNSHSQGLYYLCLDDYDYSETLTNILLFYVFHNTYKNLSNINYNNISELCIPSIKDLNNNKYIINYNKEHSIQLDFIVNADLYEIIRNYDKY